MNIFYANASFDQTKTNPYENNLPYNDSWIMLKLLNSTDFKQYTGGGIDGVFRLVITKKNIDWEYRIFDFIQYESSHNKNIIISVNTDDLENAKIKYGNHNFRDDFLRPYEQRVLMHTTTKENYNSIVNDGFLKSWNLLKSINKIKEDSPIGHLLGDPLDYSDYIMFSNGGISAEKIVSSKQKNKLEMDIDIPYIAGARFYFDAEKIAKDGLLVRDGAHVKVKDSLNIDKYVIWIATPDILDISENTTPRVFAEKADTTFCKKFSLKLNNGTLTV